MNNKLTPERIAPRGALIMAQQEANDANLPVIELDRVAAEFGRVRG